MAGRETERKCPKCGGALQLRDQKPGGTTRFKCQCQACGFDLLWVLRAAAELHVDFWDHVHAFVNDAYKECARRFMAGDLAGFEKAWLDPETGKVAKLDIYPWFADATPSAKRSGSKSIRESIQNEVDQYGEWIAREQIQNTDAKRLFKGDPE